MRAWVAAVTILSVLALSAGCGSAGERDHASHAHAVLISKILAKHRPARIAPDRAIPAPRATGMPPVRGFTRLVFVGAPVSAATPSLASCKSRGPPSA